MQPTFGTIAWLDLSVSDAAPVRDFYQAVLGWTTTPVDMNGYEDYAMGPEGAEPVAGVCHSRGVNLGIPPVWMPYVVVPDLEASLTAVVERGGEIVFRHEGGFVFVKDPAGAHIALMEPPKQ